MYVVIYVCVCVCVCVCVFVCVCVCVLCCACTEFVIDACIIILHLFITSKGSGSECYSTHDMSFVIIA